EVNAPELLQPALHLTHELSVIVHRRDERERMDIIARDFRRVSRAEGMAYERNQYGTRDQPEHSGRLSPLHDGHERRSHIPLRYLCVKGVNPARRRIAVDGQRRLIESDPADLWDREGGL